MDKVWLVTAMGAVLLPAVATDLTARRIPNGLCLAGIAAALALHGFTSGSTGLITAMLGLLLAFGLTLPLWLLGWMGAGDVKLMSAVGSLVGHGLVLPVLLAVALTGGALAVVALLARKQINSAWQRLQAGLALSMISRRPMTLSPEVDHEIHLPYAIAIALGSIGAVLMYA